MSPDEKFNDKIKAPKNRRAFIIDNDLRRAAAEVRAVFEMEEKNGEAQK